MGKNTMGSFIAALRKSKGMTQQDVAERLNVSNKTISKWECGDGYPEITVIPAIAELFEVTSDEILRGERSANNCIKNDSKSASTEKQVKFLLNKMNVKFKNFTFIAIALIIIGLISLYSVSYAFYKPMIGFGIMMIFVTGAVIIQLIAINNVHSSYETSGMLDDENKTSLNYLKMLYKYSSISLSMATFGIIFGLPFILVKSDFYTRYVIAIDTYLKLVPVLIIAYLTIYFVGRYLAMKSIEKRYFPIVSEQEKKRRTVLNKKFIIITLVTFLLTFAARMILITGISDVKVHNFENREKFENFMADKEQYEKEKEKAELSGSRIITPPLTTNSQNKTFRVEREEHVSNIISDSEVFFRIPQFENIVSIDEEILAVVSKIEPHERLAAYDFYNDIFRVLFWLEVIVIGSSYFFLKINITAN